MRNLGLEEWKNIFNIGFFLVVSTIGILSYLQARKTLFSPIKTEIFKLQIEEFKKILEAFNYKNQKQFDEETGIQEVFNINACKMHLNYIDCFFKDQVQLSEEFSQKLESAAYGTIMSKENFLKNFRHISVGEDVEEVPRISDRNPVEPALKLAKWHEYEQVEINYTKKYNDATEELSNLASSPLLPKELVEKIHKIIEINRSNLTLIGDVLTEAAKKMPTQYTTIDQTVKFDPTWIWNEYNSSRESLDQSVSDVLSYINKHLKINEIMK
ncbi:hypothetical protein [Psychrobacter sp. ANT_H59]|uniref:hypothetical protein n=1 Tax=Psychrobacter sp. ANT_H59 TaxID=2597354 RepID=UPI0011EFE27D|nr:hypothetical protein [Psychrobacter sp. ANT_H59]KAA0934725.1 hypothetical protein FQ083_07855 [Psychrobacter sp. ANT_H59]